MTADDELPSPWGERDPTDLGLPRPPPEPPRHHCTDGWAGEDDDGRPVPCAVCRPHLRREHDERTGLIAWRPRRAHIPSTPWRGHT